MKGVIQEVSTLKITRTYNRMLNQVVDNMYDQGRGEL